MAYLFRLTSYIILLTSSLFLLPSDLVLQFRQLTIHSAGARGTVALFRDNRLVLAPY